MKKILNILILLLVAYPTFSQVIKFESKNDIPFDTGVAMSLDIYRPLRLKSILCDSIIELNNSISDNNDSINNMNNLMLSNCNLKNQSYEREIDSKNKTISDLNKEISLMEYKKPFYERKSTFISFFSGVILVLLIK